MRPENLIYPSVLENTGGEGHISRSELSTDKFSTSTAAEFKKNSAQLAHEAEIVAALAVVIARPGMDNAEDEKFHGFAKTLEQSALDLRSAVAAGNYEQGRTAAGVMTKSCANCHAEFR